MAAGIMHAIANPIAAPAPADAPISAQSTNSPGSAPDFAQMMAGQRVTVPVNAQDKAGTSEKCGATPSEIPEKVPPRGLPAGEGSGKTLPVALTAQTAATVPAQTKTAATVEPSRKRSGQAPANTDTTAVPPMTALLFSPLPPLAAAPPLAKPVRTDGATITAVTLLHGGAPGKTTPLGVVDVSGHNAVAVPPSTGADRAAGASEKIDGRNPESGGASLQAPRPLPTQGIGVAIPASLPGVVSAVVSTKGLTGSHGVNPPAANLSSMPVFSGVAPTAAPASGGLLVAPPVSNHPQWSQALGQQVQFLLGQGIQQATLQLNPPHLGPLEVRLDLQQNGQTNAFFSSPHPEVREAIATAMPQLQESFAAAGMSLGQASVGAGGGGRSFARNPSASASRIAVVAAATAGATLPVRVRLGLVNTFA